MSDLDPELQALLARTRDAGLPTDDERRSVRSKIVAAAAATGAAAGASSVSALASAGAVKTVALVVALAAGGVLVHRALQDEPSREAPEPPRSSVAEPREPDRAAIAPAPSEPGRSVVTQPAAEPIVAQEVPEPPRRARSSRPVEREAPPATPEPEATSPDTLAEEIALLARGVRALHDGDPARALALLEEHERRYPNSQLARERDTALERARAASSAEEAP